MCERLKQNWNKFVLFQFCFSFISVLFHMCDPLKSKNRYFHVPQPTFLFPLETQLRLSRNMLHGWKDNSVLAKPLAACTHLSATVSQLFEPQLQKIIFFVCPGNAPVTITQNVAWMKRQFSACQTPCSIYLQQFSSYSNRKCKKSPFLRTAAHIFVSPGDAPAIIT